MIQCSICKKPKFRNDMSCDCIKCVENLKKKQNQLKDANNLINIVKLYLDSDGSESPDMVYSPMEEYFKKYN
jgi:hypothetical protein